MDHKGKRTRPPAFKLEIPGDNEIKKSLMDKLHHDDAKAAETCQ